MRDRVDVTGLVALALVVVAADDRVELHADTLQLLEDPCGADECSCSARLAQRFVITGRVVQRVDLVEQLPWKLVVGSRVQALADDRDRSLALRVDERHRPPLWVVAPRRVHPQTERAQLFERSVT